MTHGHARKGHETREYRSWVAMMGRCYQPSSDGFAKYGARGVSVCERWHSFVAFLEDMGPRPEGMSLDRIDSRGNYEPYNCRWATARQQSQNRNCVRLITIDGETRCLTEWARRAGVSDTAMLYRVRRGLTGRDLLLPSRHGAGFAKRLRAPKAKQESLL